MAGRRNRGEVRRLPPYEAYWDDLGRPARDRFGLSLTPEGEHVWLDEPAHRISTEPVGNPVA